MTNIDIRQKLLTPPSSIDDTAQHLSDKGLVYFENTAEYLRLVRTFVFSALGWQTMLYRPSVGTCPPGDLSVVEEQSGYRGDAFMELKREERGCSGHDLSEFLMGFGVLLPTKNLCLTNNTEEQQAFKGLDKVMPSSFNALLLSLMGHLQIKWVDILSCHMEFDPISKELYLFRFPSFCHATLNSIESQTNQKSVIHSCATSRGDLHEWASKREVDLLLEEILLSYRLLFGQTKPSRKFFRQTTPFTGLEKNAQDPILADLCETDANYDGEYIVERDVYELRKDFPILRSRISALHRHLERSAPSTWRELWRDKRNSAQWLTIWAVIVFGGFGIILAILQAVLQAAQLGLSL